MIQWKWINETKNEVIMLVISTRLVIKLYYRIILKVFKTTVLRKQKKNKVME